MAIVRRVLDISHHNTVNNLQTVKDAGIWGIIHKATEGTGYVDNKYAGRKKGFLEIGLLWGAYHFFHPGSVQAQVNHFLAVAGMDDTTLYALDWEQSSSGTAGEADASEFLRLLEAATGRKGVVYSGNVAKEQIHGVNQYLGSHRLWLAQYSSPPSTQASWHNNVWLWQYSDGNVGPQPHGCPGVTGDVDTNSWTGTQQELHDQWSGKTAVPVPPEPEPAPEDKIVEIAITCPPGVKVNVTITETGGVEPVPPVDALFYASGDCSWFGGPDDTGVAPDEGLAFIYEYSARPDLFLATQPPGTTGLARRLNPDVPYVACRWDYSVTPKTMLADKSRQALVRAGDREVLAWPADWGPHEDTGRVADLSPGLMAALNLQTDDAVEVIYPATIESV